MQLAMKWLLSMTKGKQKLTMTLSLGMASKSWNITTVKIIQIIATFKLTDMNIQNIEQNVCKVYEMLNKLGSNGLELLDLAFPNHDGVQDEKAAGELMYLRQSVNSLKNACELAINELNDAIQDSLEYEIIKTGYRYIDNEDGTYDVCYDHAQDSYFSEINKHHVARVRDDESTYYIIGESDSCEG